MWEAKVVAAADAAAADAADAAETNWKHKVTPDRGDLMNGWRLRCEPLTYQFWKSLLINRDFNMAVS